MTRGSYRGVERSWAAAVHLCFFIVLGIPYGLGLLAPVSILYYKRKESLWVAFQAMQALAFQSIAWVLIRVLVMLSGPASEPSAPLALNLAYGVWFLGIFYSLMGAVLCAMGRNYRYPFIGRFIQRRLRLTFD